MAGYGLDFHIWRAETSWSSGPHFTLTSAPAANPALADLMILTAPSPISTLINIKSILFSFPRLPTLVPPPHLVSLGPNG